MAVKFTKTDNGSGLCDVVAFKAQKFQPTTKAD